MLLGRAAVSCRTVAHRKWNKRRASRDYSVQPDSSIYPHIPSGNDNDGGGGLCVSP
jgi:hypothetical protein